MQNITDVMLPIKVIAQYVSSDFQGLELTMRFKASETAAKHARVLEAAARLFRQRGFDGVNVREVMQSAGLTHGAFYSHFESKEELTVAATEQAFREQLENLQHSRRSRDPKSYFVRRYLSEANRDDLGGCAMAALGVDVARHPSVRRAFTSQLRSVLSFMIANFSWRSPKPERNQALAALALAVGALILSRAVDDEDLSQEILAVAKGELL
ncbi:TetR/AcrR family transcriptional regulator [Bradyrhizobium sp. USDA 4473]